MKKQSMVALGIVLLGFMFFPVIGWGAPALPAGTR